MDSGDTEWQSETILPRNGCTAGFLEMAGNSQEGHVLRCFLLPEHETWQSYHMHPRPK